MPAPNAPTSPPASADPAASVRFDVATVGRAAGRLAAALTLGVIAGTGLGIVAFVVEKLAGLLDVPGWPGVALWALLPAYAIAGAIGGGFLGSVVGARRAAELLLIDTGVLGRIIQKIGARVAAGTGDRGERVAAAVAELEREDEDLRGKAPLGRRIKAQGYKIAAGLLTGAHRSGGDLNRADQAEYLVTGAREAIGEVGETATYITAIAMILGFAIAPVVIALT